MLSAEVSGWDVTEWAVAIAALLTALGVIWHKAVLPVRRFWRLFRAWMDRVEKAVTWAEVQMRPNGGYSVADRVTRTELLVESLHAEMKVLRSEREENREV